MHYSMWKGQLMVKAPAKALFSLDLFPLNNNILNRKITVK